MESITLSLGACVLFRCLSKENLAAAALKGSPLWNLIPFLSVKVHVLASFEEVQDSARRGSILKRGIDDHQGLEDEMEDSDTPAAAGP